MAGKMRLTPLSFTFIICIFLFFSAFVCFLCYAHYILLYILNIVCVFIFCTIIHYVYSYFLCFYNMGHVLVGDDGNSRVYRCTMKQNRKDCIVLFEESEYELVILEAYWQSRAKVKMSNNRYHFLCIHCKTFYKDKITILSQDVQSLQGL